MFSEDTFFFMLLNVFEATRSKCLYFDNKNRQKAISSGLPIFLEEAVAAHLGHQACRWPLRDVASHVRDSYSFEHNTLLEDFRNKKNDIAL